MWVYSCRSTYTNSHMFTQLSATFGYCIWLLTLITATLLYCWLLQISLITAFVLCLWLLQLCSIFDCCIYLLPLITAIYDTFYYHIYLLSLIISALFYFVHSTACCRSSKSPKSSTHPSPLPIVATCLFHSLK